MGAHEILVYAGTAILIWIPYVLLRRRRHRTAIAALAAAHEAGLEEPPSLHPLIDEALCLGCGSCVPACPEGDVLGLVAGKAQLVQPANCIGHGACKDACPQDAIALVLGTERRGVDIPVVAPDFESNVPGVFVAGELGGMGLVRNAIEQGRQAMASVRERAQPGGGGEIDVVVVGAGPAGFSASLAAMELGLRYVTLEQETLGGTVAHYPRGKIVMTAPVELPLYGRVKLRETTKESLLEFWQEVERRTGVQIRYRERVEKILRVDDAFDVVSTKATYRAKNLVLAIGRRGTPRKLGVPGEESSKVVYRLVDPEQYRGQKVLVVGGGDSALEAALALAETPGTSVALSYRGAAFSRAKPANRARVDAAAASRRLRVELESTVTQIAPGCVLLETRAGSEKLDNDAVIVCAGGVLPDAFLRSMGIELETRHGEA